MSKVRLSGFLDGSEVEVFPRVADGFTRAGGSIGRAKVKDGEISLKGLKTNASYFAVGESFQGEQVVAFMAKDPDAPPPTVNEARQAQVAMVRDHGGLASAAPGRAVEPNVISGARGSKDSKRVKPQERPVPHPNQQDVQGVPQRSDTPFGEAHPKDPDEVVPRPKQEDVKAKTPQSSSTELGEATPVDPSEPKPAVDQEDAPKGLKQSSDTEAGEITPVADPPKARRSRSKPKTTKKS